MTVGDEAFKDVEQSREERCLWETVEDIVRAGRTMSIVKLVTRMCAKLTVAVPINLYERN